MAKYSMNAKAVKEAVQKKLAGAAGAISGLGKKAAEQSGMNSLMKTIQKGPFSRRQQYKLTKNVLNKGFKERMTRGATILGVSKNMAQAKSDVAKYNYMAQQAALDRYNKVINQTAEPEAGTGEPETPNKPTTEVTPVGNY